MKRALAAAMTLVLSFPALADDRTVKASVDPGLQELSHVFGIHGLSDEKSGVSVRLFESAGGDPVMNGNRLLLAIVPDPDQEPRAWRTGIDVLEVRGVALDAQKPEIAIDVTEHFSGDEGRIETRQRRHTIRYAVDPESGRVSDSIRVRGD